MIRKIILSLLAGLGAFFSVQVQAQPMPRCGFDDNHQRLMTRDPAFSQTVQQIKNSWIQFIQSPSPQLIVNTVYEIPVVIHVIHTGGAIGTIYNPTDSQLISMIDYLNKSWAAQWASYPDTSNGGTYIPVRFVLAKRSPSCGTTTGINRVN